MPEDPGKPKPALSFVPANEAPWDDVIAVLGSARCHGGQCFCQRFKIWQRDFQAITDAEREERFRQQSRSREPGVGQTTGFLAYREDEPVAWCAVEPRPTYMTYQFSRIPWAGRDEDETDPDVWLASCFIVRKGYRRQGLTYEMARAAADFAQARGAKAIEGIAMVTEPGRTITWGELHVGSHKIFEAAGFTEVTHPTKRRKVMRIDF
jgi:GNAT superfamily N-acetyltransferase